ncbi:MAG: peptidylprolyl isomerase [Thiobacillaceae bacterium]
MRHPTASFLSLILSLVLLPLVSYAVNIVAVDQIAAVVNDEVITRTELENRYKEIVAQLRQQNTPLPPKDLLEKQLLERMITERAVLQHATSTGIRVDASQIERTVERIAEQNHLDIDGLKAALARDGMSFDKFRNDIRNEIMIARVRERDVDDKISVSDGEIEGYLQTQAAQGNEDEYNLSHILISVPENASPEQIQARRAKAQDIADQLANGADFGQLSASYSDAPNALQGGNLGWKSSAQVPTLFLDTLKTLKPGEIAPIIKSANGFHIIKLIDKRGLNMKMVVTQSHARHILIKPSELVSEADAKNRLLQIRERLENGQKFEDLARQYSEDASASKGGDLGWVNPGDTVPEFEKAMDALKPGELSQPIQTPFGWHLIQVLDRRQQDVTDERKKLLARKAIHDRKADEAYQEWVRQLRDSAYVEIRPLE